LENSSQVPIAGKGSERPAHNESILREMRQMKQSFQGLIHEISEMKSQWEKQLRFSRPDSKCQDFDSGKSEKKLLPELDGLGLGPETIQVLAEMIEKKNSDTQ
jgi:hypothetical protein